MSSLSTSGTPKMIGLIEVATKLDLDNLLVFMRKDRHQAVRGIDLELLKQVPQGVKPKIKDSREGRVYFPEWTIHPRTNSVAYLVERGEEGSLIYSMYFCNMTERPDEGIGTLCSAELFSFYQEGCLQRDTRRISVSME